MTNPGESSSAHGLSLAPPASTPRTCRGTRSHRSVAGPPRRSERHLPRNMSTKRSSEGWWTEERLAKWGVRLQGTKPASPTVVAHIASLLGALAPSHTTSLRVRGYLAQLGLAVDNDAHLHRYAKESFGSEVNIRVHRCT